MCDEFLGLENHSGPDKRSHDTLSSTNLPVVVSNCTLLETPLKIAAVPKSLGGKFVHGRKPC
jgi:hypothetical protein